MQRSNKQPVHVWCLVRILIADYLTLLVSVCVRVRKNIPLNQITQRFLLECPANITKGFRKVLPLQKIYPNKIRYRNQTFQIFKFRIFANESGNILKIINTHMI